MNHLIYRLMASVAILLCLTLVLGAEDVIEQRIANHQEPIFQAEQSEPPLTDDEKWELEFNNGVRPSYLRKKFIRYPVSDGRNIWAVTFIYTITQKNGDRVAKRIAAKYGVELINIIKSDIYCFAVVKGTEDQMQQISQNPIVRRVEEDGIPVAPVSQYGEMYLNQQEQVMLEGINPPPPPENMKIVLAPKKQKLRKR
jgi:hypothetical protein